MDCRVKPGNDNKEDSFVSTIKVLSAGAVQSMVEALGQDFERASGTKLDLIFNTAGSLRDRRVRKHIQPNRSHGDDPPGTRFRAGGRPAHDRVAEAENRTRSRCP